MNYQSIYNMNKNNPIYNEINSITDEEAYEHSSWVNKNDKKALYKIKKEILSERLMKEKNVWRIFFGDYVCLRSAPIVSDQKAGIDYKITYADGKVRNVDLKASFGDYRINGENTIAIEWKQNGIPTYTEDKKTDYVVYVYGNTNTDELYFVLLPKTLLIGLSKNITIDDCTKTDNGSGLYYRITIKDLLEKYNCTVYSTGFKKSVFMEKWLTLFK